MFRFENPFDPSKDGNNPFIDGIRYNIRNSEAIKQEAYDTLRYTQFSDEEEFTSLEILEATLDQIGHSLDDLTISDEHELLDYIQAKIC